MTKDAIGKRLDDIDDFLHNGLSERIVEGITDYLNEQTARRFRLFCKVVVTALVVALVSGGTKLLFF